MEIKSAEFLTSWAGGASPPDWGLPEIVVVGRSNVGKSSFINAILNRKSLAKTSSVPGKTRCVNYFKVNNSFILVDLPGYGYAKTSETERKKWADFINSYFKKSTAIVLVICLIDAKVGITSLDEGMLQYLIGFDLPHYAIFNKIDKLNTSEKRERIKKWNSHQYIRSYQTFSATKKIGLEEFYAILDLHLEDDICRQ